MWDKVLAVVVLGWISYVAVFGGRKEGKGCLKDMGGPRGLPFVGNALILLWRGDFAKVIWEWMSKYGKVFRFVLNGRYHVVFSDPKDIRHVLGSNKYNLRWQNAGKALEVLDMKDAGVVMNSDLVSWKLHRRTFSGALKGTALLRELAMVACHNADKLVDRYFMSGDCKETVVNVSSCFKLFSLDTIGSIAFGKDFHSLDEGKDHVLMNCVVQFYKAWDHFLLTPPFILQFLHAKSRRYLEYVQILRKIEMDTVIDAREKMDEVTQEREYTDFPSRLIQHQREEKRNAQMSQSTKNKPELTDRLICEDIREMILGGTDTTSNSLTFIFYHLAKYPMEAAKVRNELVTILSGAANEVEFFAKLSSTKFPFTDAFIKEVNRMYSVVPLLLHASSEDDVVGGYFIPKGTNVVLHQVGSSMDPDYVENPEEFRPNRWLDPKQASRLAKATFLFGYGPRNCPGQQVAWIEMRCALFSILRRVDVHLYKDGQILETKYDVLNHAKGDELLLKFRVRN